MDLLGDCVVVSDGEGDVDGNNCAGQFSDLDLVAAMDGLSLMDVRGAFGVAVATTDVRYEQVPKRGRGRPRKIKLPVFGPVRANGRPRKRKVGDDGPPRKMGRPPKLPVFGPKRPRGRPKQVVDLSVRDLFKCGDGVNLEDRIEREEYLTGDREDDEGISGIPAATSLNEEFVVDGNVVNNGVGNEAQEVNVGVNSEVAVDEGGRVRGVPVGRRGLRSRGGRRSGTRGRGSATGDRQNVMDVNDSGVDIAGGCSMGGTNSEVDHDQDVDLNAAVNSEPTVEGRGRVRRGRGAVRVRRNRGGRRGGTRGRGSSVGDPANVMDVNGGGVYNADGCSMGDGNFDVADDQDVDVNVGVDREPTVEGRGRVRRGRGAVRVRRNRGGRRGGTRGRGSSAGDSQNVMDVNWSGVNNADGCSTAEADGCSTAEADVEVLDDQDVDVNVGVNQEPTVEGRGRVRRGRGAVRVRRNRGGRRGGTRGRGFSAGDSQNVTDMNERGVNTANGCSMGEGNYEVDDDQDVDVNVGVNREPTVEGRGRGGRARGGVRGPRNRGGRRGETRGGNSNRRGAGARGGRRGRRGRGSSTNGAGANDRPPRHAPGSFGSFLDSVKHSYRPCNIDDGYYRIPGSDIDKVLENSVGRMSAVCEWCRAKYFPREKPKVGVYKRCCYEGKVMVPPGKPYPEELKELFFADTDIGRAFRNNIRLYNNGCAFAAFTHNSVHLRGRGPRTYSVHGRSYHRMGSFNPVNGEVPRYNQLYSVDSGVATQHRVDLPYHEACDARVFEIIDAVIRRENPFYDALENMQQVHRSLEAEDERVDDASTATQSGRVTLFIGNNQRRNIKQYAAPSSREEISVLVTGDTDEGKPDRYVAMYWKGKPIQYVHFANPCLDPLVYPLFFVYGQLGYSISLFSYDDNTGAPSGLRPAQADVIAAARAIEENARRVTANGQREQRNANVECDSSDEDDDIVEEGMPDARLSPQSVVSFVVEEPSVMDWSSDEDASVVEHSVSEERDHFAGVTGKRTNLLSMVDDIAVGSGEIDADGFGCAGISCVAGMSGNCETCSIGFNNGATVEGRASVNDVDDEFSGGSSMDEDYLEYERQQFIRMSSPFRSSSVHPWEDAGLPYIQRRNAVERSDSAVEDTGNCETCSSRFNNGAAGERLAFVNDEDEEFPGDSSTDEDYLEYERQQFLRMSSPYRSRSVHPWENAGLPHSQQRNAVDECDSAVEDTSNAAREQLNLDDDSESAEEDLDEAEEDMPDECFSAESVVSSVMDGPRVTDWLSVDNDAGVERRVTDSRDHAECASSKRRRLLSMVDDIAVGRGDVDVDSLNSEGIAYMSATGENYESCSPRVNNGASGERRAFVNDVDVESSGDSNMDVEDYLEYERQQFLRMSSPSPPIVQGSSGLTSSSEYPGRRSNSRDGRDVNRSRFASFVDDVSFNTSGGGVNAEAGVNENVREDPVNAIPEEEVELELDEDNELTVTSTRDSGKVTQMKFYSHMVHVREGNEFQNFSPLFHSGKLFQQYVCDAFVKVIDERLLFIRLQQGNLRAASYTQVAEQLEKRSVEGNVPVGKMVILPSSFQNSERNMRQHYRDAMQIVTKYGKPDYFITFTCNPQWEEIKSNLFPGQSAVDRPDLVARVFKLKVEDFIKELKQTKVLGTVVAYTYAIEFQKRGLPHVHLLVIVDKESKPNTPEKVDAVVVAEIPDPIVHPKLHERVTTHMIHGPCGSLNVHSACMIDHSCIKQFPKSFAAETLVDQKTFPTYRRRDNSKKPFKTRYHEVTNKWVVPYNPYLLMRFNAHVNVEVCSSLKSVKYIYKYVHKGHDRVTAVCTETGMFVDPNAASGVNNQPSVEPTPSTSSSNSTPSTVEHDEVQDHIDGRYVCAPEAMGRLLAHTTTHSSHAVYRLPVHLPMEQFMLFTEGLEREAVRREMNKPTPLLGWFVLNRTDEFARTLRYSQIAEHYVWNKKIQKNPMKSFTWTRRVKKTKVIARMHGVTMDNMELFSLRLLLLHVTGCTSYEDVRTFPENVVCGSFKEAAVKRGLLDDDACWDETMEEAIAFDMPRQLRQLFCALIVHGGVTDPLRLWEKYKEHLIEDYRVLNNEENATNMALRDLCDLLRMNGKDMSTYKLPEPGEITDGMYFDREYPVENEMENAASRIPLLNIGQKSALRQILNALKTNLPRFTMPAGLEEANVDETANTQKLFYIDGPGGTGKTFLYNTLLSIVRSRLYSALAVAPTGIAACLLPGGWTAHSRFGIPLDLEVNSTSNIDCSSRKADELRACKIVIWDEISMTHKYALAVVDRLLRFVTKIDEPFGGKVVVVGGDFRQQLPIIPGGGRADAVNMCVASSSLWPAFKKLALTENMRTDPAHREFAEWLIELGNGTIPPVDPLFPNDIEIPAEFVLNKSDGCESMVDHVFGHTLKAVESDRYIHRAILCPLNEDTFKVNNEVIERLEGEAVTFLSMDVAKPLSGDPFDPADISTELLNTQTPTGMPPHKLVLKKGAVIMLLRNLNPKFGLVNGARMVVEDAKPGAKVIKAKLVTGKFAGEFVLIPRIKLCPTDSSSSLPVKLERTQFPIRLAFSMTISKSQGQTLEYVGIILSKPVFAHGQLYTAFSRSISKLNVKVQIGPVLLENPCKVTSNIVYKEVFGLRDA